MKVAKVREIFESIQGEGILVGVRQLFIRFSGCNLRCNYCDTPMKGNICIDYIRNKIIENPINLNYIQSLIDISKNIHSVCFTGGEPMLYADFISSLRKTKPFYLETNMSLPEKAKKLKFVDYVAGDLKIREAGNPNYDELLENIIKSFKILRNTKRRLTFCKIVLPAKFNVEEIENSAYSIKDYVYCFVLQPVFGVKIDEILKLQKRIISFKDARLIPQVHKYLGVK
jgi:organic radical activating enzyme